MLFRSTKLTIVPTTNGALIKLPEYYQPTTNASLQVKWTPISPASVPADTKLASGLPTAAGRGLPALPVAPIIIRKWYEKHHNRRKEGVPPSFGIRVKTVSMAICAFTAAHGSWIM